MSKVYRGKGWEIREGRWQDSAPDSVDVVVSDAPYDKRTHDGGRHNSKDGPVAVQVAFPPVDPVEVGPPLICISRRWCVLFCAVEQLGHYQQACGDEYIRGGIWIKTDPTPQISGDRPAVWGDGVAILHRKGRKHWNRGGHPCKWVCGVERPVDVGTRVRLFRPRRASLGSLLRQRNNRRCMPSPGPSLPGP